MEDRTCRNLQHPLLKRVYGIAKRFGLSANATLHG